MSYLLRCSRNLAWFSRSSTTTSTSSGGTNVRSSDLSQASRSADGTDMAMKDAKQRANPKQTSENQQESALSTYSQFGLTIALLIGTYFLYQNYKRLAVSQTTNTQGEDQKQK